MKAMIFAAGLGTRLRPLTNDKPKALIEINGISLLEIVINKLKSYGFHEIILNVHYLAERIIEFLEDKKYFNIRIAISDERDQLLDTGGGLKKARWFFNDNKPFLLHNVDILSDIDFKGLYEAHLQFPALVTLAVRKAESTRSLLFNGNNLLCGWRNIQTDETRIAKPTTEKLTPLSFCGIHVINPSIFDLIEEKGAFSIIDLYLRLAKSNIIKGCLDNSPLWIDVGKKENLTEAGRILDQMKNK